MSTNDPGKYAQGFLQLENLGKYYKTGGSFFFCEEWKAENTTSNQWSECRGKLEILEEKWIESVDDGRNRSIHLDFNSSNFHTPETGKYSSKWLRKR